MPNGNSQGNRNYEGRTRVKFLDSTMNAHPIFTDEDIAEFDAEAFYAASEALEAAEFAAKSKGITRAEIGRRLGMDKGTVTRILGGSQRNITLKTLFSLMRAMNRKVFITSCNIDDLHHKRPNFSFDINTSRELITIYTNLNNSPQINTTTFIKSPTKMKPPFQVEQLLLCEYATQDFRGNFVIAGIHGGAIVAQDDNEANWSKIKIFCELTPIEKSFEAEILLKIEGGKDIIKVKFSFEKRSTPEHYERCVFNLDIPPAKIEIKKKYLLQTLCNKKVMRERTYQAFLGGPPPSEQARVQIMSIEPAGPNGVPGKHRSPVPELNK